MPPPSALYPVDLVLEGRRCLVVGAGPVALRKVHGLLSAGAEVTVVAPEALAELAELAELAVQLERRPYRRGEVAGYRLVVAATGIRDVDRTVAADAESAGVLVNVADDLAACTVVLPAVLRRGRLSVAVSSDGTSPAMASWLRDRLAAVVTEQHGELAELVARTRAEVRASGRSSEGLAWTALIDELAGLLAAGRGDEAGEAARRFAATMPAGGT